MFTLRSNKTLIYLVIILMLSACSKAKIETTIEETTTVETTTQEEIIINDIERIKPFIRYSEHYTYFMIKYDSDNVEAVGANKDNWFNDIYFYSRPERVGEYIIIKIPITYGGKVYLKDGDNYMEIR